MITILCGILLGVALGTRAEGPVYSVKVSPNGRYFIDQKGKPIFWLGTTQWQGWEDALWVIEGGR